MCASNGISAIKQLKPRVKDLLILQDGVVMFDALWNQDVLVVALILACLCDNPRVSEIVGDLRGNPNSFCRQCLVSRITCIISALYVHIIIPVMQCDKKVHPDVICDIDKGYDATNIPAGISSTSNCKISTKNQLWLRR